MSTLRGRKRGFDNTTNNHGYVSDSLRARIEKALHKADYHPDQIRALRLRERRTIALIVPDLECDHCTAGPPVYVRVGADHRCWTGWALGVSGAIALRLFARHRFQSESVSFVRSDYRRIKLR